MQKMRCIIIEDEPLAAEILADYVSQVPFLELTGVCSDAIQAMQVLGNENIELIFLDIHLPKLKGIDFVKTLDHPPKIIITTAYQDYALQGFEINVVDYLLKPIEFTRFLSAVNKANQTKSPNNAAEAPPMQAERAYLFFNVGKKRVKIFVDEILYIESLKEYVKIVSQKKSILTKLQLSETEELLKDRNFLRIHRSFIVAKSKIDAFSATDIEISGVMIPIGRSYKEQVYAELER